MIEFVEVDENEQKILKDGELVGFLVKFDDDQPWCCYYLAKTGEAEEQYNGCNCFAPVDYESDLKTTKEEIMDDLD